MINKKYYEGFEGEKEVKIYNDSETGFEIWDGYFETLMSGCDTINLNEGGLLYSYVTREGFYEEEMWKMPNPELAIKELESFQANNAETESKEMVFEVEYLRKDLLFFMKSSQDEGLNIYVRYD